MIRNLTVRGAMPFVEKLLSNGIRLSAVPGTPLADLMTKSYTPLIDGRDFYSNGTNELRVWQVIECLKQPNTAGFSEHCETVDDIRCVLSKAVASQLDYARNTVTPQILELVDAVHHAQEESQIRIGSSMSILQDEWDEIWSNPVLYSMIESVKYTALNPEITIPRVHPLLTEEQLRTYMNTGADRFDRELQKWIDNVGIQFISDTYSYHFVRDVDTGRDWGERDFDKVNWLLGTDAWSRKQSIVVYLLSRGLRANVPEGVDMSDTDYQYQMSLVQAQAGRVIARCIEYRSDLIKNKSVILAWPVNGVDHLTTDHEVSQILVNSDVYNDWLDQGGSPEVIFGSAITDRETKPELLLERAENYRSAWKQHEAIIRSGQRSLILSVIRDAIVMHIGNLITNIPADALNGRSKDGMFTRLREASYMITMDGIKDIYQLCTNLLCQSIHYHTNALLILDTMRDISKENPDLKTTEVTTIAAIDILAKWFADQCQIIRC